MCEQAGEAAGGIATQWKSQLGAAINDRPAAVSGHRREAGAFEDGDPGVFVTHIVGGGDYLVYPRMIQKAADAGAESWQVHGVVSGSIKTVDADRTRFGDLFRREVHLDGRMYFKKEERAVQVGDQIGAIYLFPVGFHAVINLPKPFVGIGLQGGTVEFFTKDLADE